MYDVRAQSPRRRSAPVAPGLPKLQSLEAIRAIAALLVVLFHSEMIFGKESHLQTPLGGLFASGYRGVDLFFVLSGFVIAYVHRADIGRPSRLANYAFNRLVRIYPAVWITTAAALTVYLLKLGGTNGISKLPASAIFASFMLLPSHSVPLVNVTWTLTYEMFFYALFGLVIVRPRIGLAAMLAWQAAIVAIALLRLDFGFTGYYFRSMCLEFGLGVMCAWWFVSQRTTQSSLPWCVTLAAGAGIFVFGMAMDGKVGWGGVACALGAAAIVLGAAELERASGRWPLGWLSRLGGASYAIYLIHFSVVTLFAAALRHIHVTATNSLCLAGACTGVSAGILFDYLVDKPVQRWLRRRRGSPNPSLQTKSAIAG